MVKDLYKTKLIDKDSFSDKIEEYIEEAILISDSIYFYRIDPLSINKQYDKLLWIKDIKHEEFDRIRKVKKSEQLNDFLQIEHNRASSELSNRKSMGNRVLRKWCAGAYNYNSKKPSFEFDKK